jgi:hypothetical protein
MSESVGLIVPTENPEAPEHPACAVIRGALSRLADELGQFEQTDHGLPGPFSIESVAEQLARCYIVPSAYQISSLSQEIVGFLKGVA